MPWLVDDLAGAALGPWGLAVVAGVGVGALVSKRLGSKVAGVAGEAASGVAAGAAGTRDQVRDRVTSGLTDVRGWWREVYAEAHAEWEQSRATKGASAVAAIAAPASAATARARVPSTTVARTGTPRVRGTNGRYVKPEQA